MAYINDLYTKKRQYENLRPALVTCKNYLIQAKNSITFVVDNTIDCFFIDGNGYRQSDNENQKKNIENRLSDLDRIISKLDDNYDSVCYKIREEEKRINNSKNNNRGGSSKGSSSSSSNSSGSRNTSNNNSQRPIKSGPR